MISCLKIEIILAANITVDDILNKLQQNIISMNDLKAEVSIITSIDTKEVSLEKMRFFFKKNDKFRIEHYFPSQQTIVIENNQMHYKLPDNSLTSAVLPPKINLEIPQFIFSSGIKNLLVNFNVELNINNSNELNNIFLLELTPITLPLGPSFPDTSQIPSRIEATINYNFGMVTKITIYNKNNILIMENKVENYSLISGVYIPIKLKSKILLPNGNSIEAESIYENIQINSGIADEEFEIK